MHNMWTQNLKDPIQNSDQYKAVSEGVLVIHFDTRQSSFRL